MTPFLIVFVCRANQCRSAMAEMILRQRLAARPDVRDIAVASAGTEAWDGIPMAGVCGAGVQQLGVDRGVLENFRSQRLTAALISSAGVVLTMERGQRDAVGALDPAAARERTFTVREFARLTAADRTDLPPGTSAGERARLLVTRAAEGRDGSGSGPTESGPGESDDIFDPIGGRLDDVNACLGLLTAALDPLLRVILDGPDPV
jgi:protein-tyrosine phosphatase